MTSFRTRVLCSAAVAVLAGAPLAAHAQVNPDSARPSPGAGQPVPPSQSPASGPPTASATPPDGGASPQAAPTPTASQPDQGPVQEVVVTGVRASLQSAQAIRRNSTDIVDSIVAQDIGKLPDNTVGDALQRVTGVQITRAAGEAGTVLIRGLPNVTTEINGRDIFTSTGRSVALSDIPAELVAGVDVYKTVSPEQLEGGIAGTINIRLRRPFDFGEGLQVAGTARAIYGDQRDAIDPNASLLISDRWMTGAGEVGALLSVSYQKRRYLDETAFNFVSIAGPTGVNLQIPQTSGDIAALGDRERTGVDMSLQWRPKNNLEFYFDGTYTGYRNSHSSSYFIGIPGAGALQSYTVEPGTANEVASLTSANNFTLTSDQAYRDRTNTWQGAFGGKWTQGPLTVTSDLSFTYSLFRSKDLILDTRFNAPTYAEDFNANGTPNFAVGGVDLTNASNFYLNQLFDNRSRQIGKEIAYRIDGTYETDGIPFIKSVAGGIRYSFRDAKSEATNGNGIPIPAGVTVSAASLPGLGTLSPGDFLGGLTGVNQWFTANSDYLLSHADTLRAIFGQPLGDQAYDPTKAFRADQDSYAGYVKANFGFNLGPFPASGDFGIRLVQTEEDIVGFEVLPYTSTLSAVDSRASYRNALPSFNGKLQLTHDLFFRVSAGKTVTFPDFGSLNPALSLNSPGPTLIGTGSAGNPDLRPITSTNVDTALEWYFAKAGSLTGTYFHRDINGYIQTYGVNETVNNVSYLVSLPESTGAGELQGAELAYQQFYDFLPGLFRGLGAQLNFTYIDSYTQAPASLGGAAVTQALANVSRYSLNAIGLYELGPVSVRAAYNWRSKYVIGFNAGGLQPQTIISDPVGQFDVSASYALSPRLVLTLDMANLTQEITQNYFGSKLYPRDTDRSDRTFELGVRFRL